MNSKDPKIKILFLSGGSLVGQNVIAGLEGRRQNCKLIVLNSVASEPAVFFYDQAHLVPSLVRSPESFSISFKEIIANEEPDLLIPCRDEDVFFLANFIEENPEYKGKALVGPSGLSRFMLDKNLSYEFSKELGLPFVPTIAANSAPSEIWEFVETYKLPLLIKPVKGFASLGVRILYTKEQINSIVGKDNLILQQYIGSSSRLNDYLADLSQSGVPLFHSFEEEKISVQGCISSKSEVLNVFVTRHKMKNGVSAVVEVCDDSSILSTAKLWVDKIAFAGWRGPINIQSQFDEKGELFIYEYNGRFTGATSGRVLIGMDEIGIILNHWLLGGFPVYSGEVKGKKVVRAPISRLVDDDEVSILSSKGVWRKK